MDVRESGVLIVDDESSVSDSLLNWFRKDGFRTATAENATAALTKLQEGSWDIVLLDIRMPGMDGIELQRRIHEIDPDIAVIMITAYASVETAVQALKQGAFDYVTKAICSDTRREPSPEPSIAARGRSRWRMAARCSWTTSAP